MIFLTAKLGSKPCITGWKNSQSQLPSATINMHVIRSRSGSQRTLFLSTRLNPLTWWVYPPYSVRSSSCWSFVFAGPHRSDLLNIKAVHVHLTYEDSTVRGGPFGISNLFLYRILSLCCLYFAICNNNNYNLMTIIFSSIE